METSRYCGKTIISLVKLKTEALDLGRQFIFGTNDKLFHYVEYSELTAEKHRADVLKIAFNLACEHIQTDCDYCEVYKSCRNSKDEKAYCKNRIKKYYMKQAEEMLKEKKE